MSGPEAAPAGRLQTWIDERVGLKDILKVAKKKEVPLHRHSFWYYFGGMSLFLFTIQVVTGILLLLYYRPSAEQAYESVQFIMAEVEFGWLIRSIHAWSANLLIFVLFVHLFSVLLLKAYRRPRELTWLSGFALFGLFLGFGFTGYLLPWNQLSYFATRVGTEIPGVIPGIGGFLRRFLRGEDEVTGATLTRFYGIHVAILPALVTAILGIHLFLVQKHGMSVPPGVERNGAPLRKLKFFPNYALRDAVGWLCALAVLAALAAFFPTELGKKADPFSSAPPGIRPEWYFMFMFQTLKYLPEHILGIEGEVVGILGFTAAGLFVALIPFIDRRSSRGQSSPLITVIALGMIAFIIVLTYLGYTASPTK